MDCSPQSLLEAASCFRCMTGMHWAARTYLLCQWASMDPDAQTFIDAAGITEAGQKNAINQLVRDLKNKGGATSYWDRDALIYPFVGGTPASHKVNLKSPGTYDLTYGGAPGPTHNALGMKGDLVSAFASTGYLLDAAQQDSVRAMVYIEADTAIHAVYYFGTASIIAPIGRFFLRNDTAAPPIGYSVCDATTSAPSIGGATEIGAKFVQRRVAAQKEFGTDGDPWYVEIIASTGLPTRHLTLLAYNNGGAVPGGTPGGFCDARISGFSLGAVLDDAERLEYKGIWDTFENAVGRGHP